VDIHRMMKTPAPDVSLSEFASGRKSEAPAPAAQQDKTAGRTELPHRFLKSTNLRFWSSSIRLEFDSSVSVLLFAHSRNAKSRGKLRKTERAKFPALKSRIEISEIQLSGWGPDCPAWGHALVGL
jgi:hypothetical protein